MFIYLKGQLLINHYWKQNSKNRSTAFLGDGVKIFKLKKTKIIIGNISSKGLLERYGNTLQSRATSY